MLKGGGCENVGAQYSLPDSRVGAGRDLKGVEKCILDAVQNAQGKGCGPGILGVCIGGDRGTGYAASKEQFLRKIGDRNRDATLASLEARITDEANQLGIGPMGFGGKTTLLATKITALNRVPASFFVSVSYMCWAFRRQGARVGKKRRDSQMALLEKIDGAYQLTEPFTEEKVRSLRVGDMVEITGELLTGRDAVHKWLDSGNEPPESEVRLKNSIIYHCGPVIMKKGKKWVATAAGPTTSIREEPYQAKIIEKFGLKAVIGKGGMGEKTKNACKAFGCVYLHAVGGAAQVLAERIVSVDGVFGLEQFGSPEAIWKLKVERFPVVVTIDAHGNSLHQDIEAESGEKFKEMVSKIGK